MSKMNANAKEFTYKFGEQEVCIQTGKIAKQADGAAFVTMGGTQILGTVCSAKSARDGQDFFPLLVDYRERFYAAGKFLGGFMKREGRPSNKEILLSRLIDRPLRPLFPKGYLHDTIVYAQVHSFDSESDPEVVAGIAASTALTISDVPFSGPVGFCKVGRINGKFILNPGHTVWKDSDLELVVVASKDAILMVEGEARELSEAEMLEAISFAHENIKGFCDFLIDIQKQVGKKKREFTPVTPSLAITETTKKNFESKAKEILAIDDKLERQNATHVLEDEVKAHMAASFADYGLEESADFGNRSRDAVDQLLYDYMRNNILHNKKRIGGRGLTEVRSIETETGILKRTHGSSLFTRGETQVLSIATLGGKEGEQMVDDLNGVNYTRFYLHYTFAPYCVGEARGYRGVGRREVGHGNLAERALKNIIDPDCPYTIRLACEVTESNGSSSMGSVCGGSMALMQAGIKMKAPVAGVAMGLIKDEKDYVILTDILGDEDHLGDMDFKIAGTSEGITAIQMDIKITGITTEIFEKALAQAREGRLHILGEMNKTISATSENLTEWAPKIEMIQISPDKIGALIGPSGKNIKALQERYEINIACSDDGKVQLIGHNQEKIDAAKRVVDLQINGPELGSDYFGEVVSIKEYGAFVDLVPGLSGLLHVSEITGERISDVRDYLQEGDKVNVRVLEIDRFGKVKLSAKAVNPLEKREE